MIIDLNPKEKLVVKNALIKYLGWKKDTYADWIIWSPTRPNIRLRYNSFVDDANDEISFKPTKWAKIQLDTDAKLLIFGDKIFAINVA